MIGFGYSSQFTLLNSEAVVNKLANAETRANLSKKPYAFGRKIVFGPDLDCDSDGSIVYIQAVAPSKLLSESKTRCETFTQYFTIYQQLKCRLIFVPFISRSLIFKDLF
jgi:hypothetical protein